MVMNVKAKDHAPEIVLPDQNGKIHKLSDYKGKWVLVYFYPKDGTPGCTKEACSLRDSFSEFNQHDAVVLGVSTDSQHSHKKFEEKYQLPFTLLADEKKEAVKAYGVEGGFLGGAKRSSVLVDPEGLVAKVYEEVDPETHSQEVLNDLKNLGVTYGA
jgi:peroxiredoxin Q/BCP